MVRLPSNTLKRLVSLHGWTGTVLSIMLYVVMLTGTVIVFDNEIQRWSGGAMKSASLDATPLDARLRDLAGTVPATYLEEIGIASGQTGGPRFSFTSHAGPEDMSIEVYLDKAGTVVQRREGSVADLRETRPGAALERFIVNMHVQLHLPQPWGLYLTGILGFAMLIAAMTGVLIHRHILRDAFITTRPGGRIVGVRDRHTLAGVWGLPFATLLAFTGAFLSFATSLGLPVVAIVAFGGDQAQALATVLGEAREVDTTWRSLALIDPIIAQAKHLAGTVPSALIIRDYGTVSAQIETLHTAPPGGLSGVTLVFDGTSGQFLEASQLVGAAPSVGSTLVSLMAPLHFGTFAGLLSKAVWAGLGAAMTYSIVSGMQLWLRRRADDPVWAACRRWLIGTVWGLPIALVGTAIGYFVSAPFGAGAQGCAWGFVFGLLSVAVYLPFRTADTDADVSETLRLTLAIGLACLPVLRMSTGGPGWISGVWNADPAVLGLDLTLLWLAIWVGLTPLRNRKTHLVSLATSLRSRGQAIERPSND